MSSLEYYITEASKPSDYKERLTELKAKADEKGLKVVFRDASMGPGDFCIFIYDKKKQQQYLVGYDGYWQARRNDTLSFDYCYMQAEEYIKKYKK